MPKKIPEPSGFLNVDLDVHSRSNLAPLAAALEPKTIILFVGWEGTRHGAHFELLVQTKNADATIRGLAGLVRALPRAGRKLWDGATTRDFSIGIQSDAKLHEIGVSAEAIAMVAALKGRIVIVVYPESQLKKRSKRRRST